MSITGKYSGIVLNQNHASSGTFDWRDTYGGSTVYQTFYLPSNYELGSLPIEQRIPDLSGLQVLVNLDTYGPAATLDYTLDYYIVGEGWANLTNGTAIGAQATGDSWFDVIFDSSIPVTSAMIETPFRFGITTRTATSATLSADVSMNADGTYVVEGVGFRTKLIDNVPYPTMIAGVPGFLILRNSEVSYFTQQGIKGLHYTTPSPLVMPGQVYSSDAKTPLLSQPAALNFRVLGLTADHGTDFMGNEYRSCALTISGNNAETTGVDTNTWTSPPMPSKFSVLSRYFDVRPAPGVPTIGVMNPVVNPSFEYDVIDSNTAYGWMSIANAATTNIFQIQDSWADAGIKSLRYRATFTGLPNAYAGVSMSPSVPVTVTAGQTYSARCSVNIQSLPGGSTGLTLFLNWLSPTGAIVATVVSNSANTLGITEVLTINGTVAPPTATSALLTIVDDATSTGTLDFYLDAVQMTNTPSNPSYFDGDTVNAEWLGHRGQSISAQIDPVVPTDNAIVIDGILVDPITPNVAFNVYYSHDDAGTSDRMTERDWEQKLWTRVPQAYTATQRQQYVFPEPITAKYVKVEFTNLQAQPYDPGTLQQAVTYKKFPTWVADYFIAQMASVSFVSNLVNVENDALTFAYDYYLDDVKQEPSGPVAAPADVQTIDKLAAYFKQNDASGLVDAVTLNNINLIMHTFSRVTGSITDRSTLFGQYVADSVNTAPAITQTMTYEFPQAPQLDYAAVSTTSREAVIFEQSLPVMYFFLTCRHAYKELQATFDYNRAYFAGVNDIQFLRHNYHTTSDDRLYIETGGDTANADINDFVVDTDQTWYTY